MNFSFSRSHNVAISAAIIIMASMPCLVLAAANHSDSIHKQPRLPRTNTSAAVTDSIKTYNVDNIVVTGARNEVLQSSSPVRVEVINRKKIESTGMVNLGNILQEQTGVAITTNVRSGVQLMGMNPDYTLILIDGQPVIGRVAGVIDLSRISVGNIQQVEIVKGPMSSLYGSEALAGVINIITRKPSEGVTAKLYGQLISRGASEAQAELNYGGNRVDVALFGNYKRSEPFERMQVFEENSHRDTMRTPFSGFTDYTLQGRVKWYAADNASFGANVRYFSTASEGSFAESFFGQIATNKGSVTQNDLSATLSGEWTLGKARLSFQTYASRYDETYNFDVSQGQAGRTDSFIRRISRSLVQYDLLWNLKNRFTLGGEFQYDDASGTRYPDQPLYRTFIAFGQWEGNPTADAAETGGHDWISYALSARFDATSAFGSSFNPRLSVLLKPAKAVQVRLSGGTGFKAPDFRQLFVEFSNRLPGAGYDLIGAYRLGNTLAPERSTAFDVGVVLNAEQLLNLSPDAGSWAFDARVFRNDISNLIEFYLVQRVGDRDVYSYRNLARAYTQGLEANLRGVIPISLFALGERLSVSVGYQYLEAMDVEVLEAISHGVAGTVNPSTGAFQPLARKDYGGLWFRSPHTGNIRVQYDNDALGLTANVRAQYVGSFGDESLDKNGLVIGNPPRKVPDRADEFAPGYVNLNCAISKTFTFADPTRTVLTPTPKLLRVTAGMNNALDVINLRSTPGIVGRQFFVNAAIEW